MATHLLKAKDWPDIIKMALKLKASAVSTIYGLTKIHKEGCRVLPIVNTIGSLDI